MPTESFLVSFAETVERTPNAPALSWNGRSISYRELFDLAQSASSWIRENGLSGEHPVCLVGGKSPQLVAMLVACFLARRRVLLPPSDLGGAALVELCELAGCRHLIRVGATSGQPTEPVFLEITDTAGGDRPPPGPPGLMLTTSGSTGLPKIVPLSERGVDRFLDWAAGQFEIGPGAVVLNYAPLNFDLCLLDVWASLATGACVVLVDSAAATNGPLLLDLAARATVVQAVPMLFRLLADAAAGVAAAAAATRHVVFTGDVTPPELVGRVRRLFPQAALYNLYGCTETNDSFLHRVEGEPTEPLPIGRPVPGVTAAVVDADGRVAAGPATGELLVRTPFQAGGYLDPRLDEGRFVPAPAGLPAGTYYRTGDLVRRDETGVVTLLGRADFHVKVRGVRVNTQEVETVIGQHAEVLEAAVVAIPDELAGHRLHALIRRRPGATLDGLQLREHCAARLSRTAIPGRVEIVDRPLPRTSTGKIDRNRIRLSANRRN